MAARRLVHLRDSEPSRSSPWGEFSVPAWPRAARTSRSAGLVRLPPVVVGAPPRQRQGVRDLGGVVEGDLPRLRGSERQGGNVHLGQVIAQDPIVLRGRLGRGAQLRVRPQEAGDEGGALAADVAPAGLVKLERRVHLGGRVEGLVPTHDGEHDDAEREHVHGAVVVLSVQELRREVAVGPRQSVEVALAARGHLSRKPEVPQLGDVCPAGQEQEDVPRLDIPVDDGQVDVEVPQRADELRAQVARLELGEGAPRVQRGVEVSA
mmetsp:Transcript_7654/g.20517  ORF Transcript_7654/g.20517 Transcript_7654/m.20517 type:complete len:264 (+) Transcript_7654:147-938(+)